MRNLPLVILGFVLCFSALNAPAATPASLVAKARDLAGRVAQQEAAGMPVSPDIVATMNDALAANANLGRAGLDALDKALDAANSTLMSADAPGATATVSPAIASAGSTTDFVQTLKLKRSLPDGATLLVAMHWRWPWQLQTVDPGGTDFVSVSVAGRADAFEISRIERQGLYGGLDNPVSRPAFTVKGGPLAAGSAITIRYHQLHVPARAIRLMPLPVLLRSAPGQAFVLLAPANIEVTAGKLERISIFAPSIVTPGQDFSIPVQLTDRFDNLARGRMPPLDVVVDGIFTSSMPAGDNPSPSVPLTLASPGLHKVEIRSAGGGLNAVANVQVVANPSWQVVWAELHAVTDLGSGLASADAIRHKMSSRVDTLVLADSDEFMTSERWQARPEQTIDGFTRAGRLTAGGQFLVLHAGKLDLDQAPRQAWPGLPQLVLDARKHNLLMVAMPEIPSDLRFIDPAVTRLAEIKAGPATFEWFGNRVARAGYRVGFTGSITSRQREAGVPPTVGRTAVMVKPGETLFSALSQGRTWVTSGPRLFLQVNVNGGLPGERVAASDTRDISGRVIGTAPIAKIELLRNGEVIDTRDLAGDSDSTKVQVTFDSDSAPVASSRDLPRNGREWIGYIKLSGASLGSVDTTALVNDARQAAAINPADPQRVDFITWTRGQPSGFSFDTVPGEGDMTLDMTLGASAEDTDVSPLGRPPARIPAARMIVSLDELKRGMVTRRYAVDGYRDTVTFELVRDPIEKDVSFEFHDQHNFGGGDYYYVRVTQVDGNMAWSSPVWVGGFDPR